MRPRGRIYDGLVITCPVCGTVYLSQVAARRLADELVVDCRQCGVQPWQPRRVPTPPLLIDPTALRSRRRTRSRGRHA